MGALAKVLEATIENEKIRHATQVTLDISWCENLLKEIGVIEDDNKTLRKWVTRTDSGQKASAEHDLLKKIIADLVDLQNRVGSLERNGTSLMVGMG